MSDITKKQEMESDFYSPLLFEKRLFSEAEVKELGRLNQAVSVENGEILAAGKISLNKFVEKKEAFVRRLEKELEACKSENAQVVKLTEATAYYKRSCDSSDHAQENEDPDGYELEKWCRTAEESVKTQKDKLYACARKWFETLQKSVSRNGEDKSPKVDKDRDQSTNLLMYVAIALICVLSAFLFYGPEDVQFCTEEPMQCVAKDVKDFLQWAKDSYLEFHNISLENQEV